MNYKALFKNQDFRFKILKLLSCIPDKTMVKIQYRIKTGRHLDLNNPKRFTEKLQWYKIYYRNPIMHQCVDKYEVRKYVESKGLSNILNELYGVYDSVDEIDFDNLPEKFVAKTTAGSGGQNVFICADKSKINTEEFLQTLDKWQKNNPKKNYGREWAYEGIKNRIIIEKLLESDKNGLADYKFFCFNGEIKYIYVISERQLGHRATLGIYDAEFNKINAYRCDEQKQIESYKKPNDFELMKQYATILSKDFPHARIDFYENSNRIIFGEITFYDGSGYMTYEPDEFDYRLGEDFNIGDINE